MNFEAFWSDFIVTILSGFLLALLFFWVREKVFPLPNLTGRWHFEMLTVKTAYKPYEGMVLRYVAMLTRIENKIEGTVEKIYERSSTVERNYVGKDRTRGVVTGYIEKNYFGKDKVFLHVVEDGHGRESTTFFNATVISQDKMDGTFTSMVADQDGEAFWQRDPF